MMYNYVQEYWAETLDEERARLAGMDQQQAMEQRRKIAWMESTEMAVVVSQEQNEIDRFRKWGLDIAPHRQKMEERQLDDEFKDANNPFRIVFVCAMWLTGFDVKSLSAMYFDKPLKAHGLMQAIARANRVSKGKSNGLIIDYIGVVKALRKALADYTENPCGGDGVDPVVDKDELLARISELTDSTVSFVSSLGYELESLLTAEGFDKVAEIKNAADCVSQCDETKKRYGAMCRELFTLYKYVSRQEVGEELLAKRDALRAVFNHINAHRASADTTELMVQLQGIVSDHVVVSEASEGLKTATKFDISSIDFNRLSQEFARAKRKHLIIDDLRSVIEARLETALRGNPRRIDYFERYERIIESYNSEQDKAMIEKTFNDLINLSRDLDDKQKEWVREGFQNQQQMTVFEMLFKDTLTPAEIKQVKCVAIEMVSIIEERLANMVRWTEKTETRDIVRLIVRNEVYKLPESSYPDEALPGCIEEIFNYFYGMDRAA